MESGRSDGRSYFTLLLLKYLQILWIIIWILLIISVITLCITLWGMKNFKNQIVPMDLLIKNNIVPSVNEDTWSYGKLNYEWEYLKVEEGDNRKSMNIYLDFSNLQLRGGHDESFVSDFIITFNPMRVKITFEEVPEEHIVKLKSLNFVHWEGFGLEPMEEESWGPLKWLVMRTVQLFSSNFIVKYAIQSNLANGVRNALENYNLRQDGKWMYITSNTEDK